MGSSGNDEQFRFLISCIRFSNSGKVDFTEVARECGIVSKGAAAKRYERMMKAHGIAPNGASTTRGPPASPHNPVRREPGAASKKRKLDQFSSDGPNGATDDDESLADVKKEVTVKEELRFDDESLGGGERSFSSTEQDQRSPASICTFDGASDVALPSQDGSGGHVGVLGRMSEADADLIITGERPSMERIANERIIIHE